MELLRDMHRFGPAPTKEREMAAAAANLVLLVVVAGVLVFALDASLAALVAAGAGMAYLVARLVVAVRRDRAGLRR